MKKFIEGFVLINGKRICHKSIFGKIGEIFGWRDGIGGVIIYGVSCAGKDYELYEHELIPIQIQEG